MELLVKNKLGFIDGACLKSSYRGKLRHQWKLCNVVVFLWIGHTVSTELQPSIIYASDARKVSNEFKERFNISNLTMFYHLWTTIGTLRQGTDFITSYYTKMKDLWDEMDLMVPGAGCEYDETRPFLDQFKNLCLLQFLVSLNDNYSHVRSEILLKTHVLTVYQAYALAVHKESQKTLSVANSDKEPLIMLAGRGRGFKAARKPGPICDYYSYKGHLKENCYKIISYPPDFKSKKKPQNSV
ncbi:uncharacterized protein LOC142176455 [Nicotiana tabacum]|uniref:Uncharacterized protein LOC142176455 n=1 Tax=Nicotiana tabacum TaxID=4097 RepID=A0AC58TT29_TOBAC